MKKFIGGLLLLFLCLAILFVVARNFIVKAAMIRGIEAFAGLKVEMQKIDIGLFSPTVEITSLQVFNPEGFRDKIMADIPLIYVDYDLRSLFGRRIQLKKIKIAINEFRIIMNEQGKLNFHSLALIAPAPSDAPEREVRIDELYLKVGKVGYKGYFPVIGTQEKELNMNIDETFRNVTNPAQLGSDILRRILARLGVPDFSKEQEGFKSLFFK